MSRPDDDEAEYSAADPLQPDAQAFLDNAPAEPDEKPPAKVKQDDREYNPADQTPAVAPEEDLARKLGWAPKESWRGPEDKWVDAATFIERASPAHWAKKFEEFEQSQTRTVERLERLNQDALERARREADQQVEALKRERAQLRVQYARDEDWESLERLDEVFDEAVAEVRQTVAPPAQPDPKVQAVQTEAQAWASRRPAYNTDPVFRAAAYAMMDQVNQELGDKPPAEHFAELDRRLARRFPEVYGQERRSDAGAPPPDRDVGGVRVSGKASTNYASRLPSHARQQGERFVKQGLYKSIEDYAKEYAKNE
jgi:hypothetical protein